MAGVTLGRTATRTNRLVDRVLLIHHLIWKLVMILAYQELHYSRLISRLCKGGPHFPVTQRPFVLPLPLHLPIPIQPYPLRHLALQPHRYISRLPMTITVNPRLWQTSRSTQPLFCPRTMK